MAFGHHIVVLTLVLGTAWGKLQDLSWVMDMDHISAFPGFQKAPYKFQYNISQKGTNGAVEFMAFNIYSTVEHMGTHVDAPYHFNEKGRTMDKVPLEDLIGPLVLINITRRAVTDPDASVIVQDLLDWEEKYGNIPDRSFIVMSSGWEKYYGDDMKYIGFGEAGDIHFPGFSSEAIQWLLKNRKILGAGVDTLSCDPGNVTAFPVHELLCHAEKVCLENVKNLNKVPECGARLSAAPIMMKGGTGSQTRIYAEWTHDDPMRACNAANTLTYPLHLFALIHIVIVAIIYHIY